MPKLRVLGRDNNGVIKVRNVDIERFAYQQLNEYQLDYFKQPHKLDIDDFVEFYLKRDIRYCGLNYTYNQDKTILGMTIIKDDISLIYNDDNEPFLTKLKLKTICIDQKACGTNARVNFTIAHECWHSQFDLNLDISVMPTYSGHKFFIDNDRLRIVKIRSPAEWMDYHADKYATYLLMPKPFVEKLFNDASKYYNRLFDIIRVIAKKLDVSNAAVKYRLLELKLIKGKQI